MEFTADDGQTAGSLPTVIYVEILQRHVKLVIYLVLLLLLLLLLILFFLSKQIKDDELHRIVFDYLKQGRIYDNLVKCDKTNEPISELVEQITINQPTLVKKKTL